LNRRLSISAVALAIVIAACASPGTSPVSTGTQAPATPAGETDALETPAGETDALETPAGETDALETPAGEAVELTIESWRTDDLAIWEDQIIPAFEAANPSIQVTFGPTAPTEYNAALDSKLQGGTAGDLITCRPFDASLALFEDGHLASLNDLAGLANFGDVAKSAWITDDGSDVFCVPMASVIHGFIYNADIFAELGITATPTTVDEFHALLDQIATDGTYTPLAMGTKDQWESATMGFQNIGPNYWKGEEGRQALIAGTAKFTDQPYIDTWTELASWAPYLPDGYEAIAYGDAQQYFASGQAAMYPAGSWDIAYFEGLGVNIGFFGPPVPAADDTCYISDHTDLAIGMNTATEHPDEAGVFLDWVASSEFATLYANALPGFYSLSNDPVTLDDPVAQQALDLREPCEETIRNSYQILSRGEPNLENELWRVTAAVVNGTLTPEEAGQEIQAGLEQWYEPAQ
jgi:raffinose/stachyose/melibiose transport system substrate-binding protein